MTVLLDVMYNQASLQQSISHGRSLSKSMSCWDRCIQVDNDCIGYDTNLVTADQG